MVTLNIAPISFAEFMDQALYGPAGYYSSGRARSGRSGDYFTAPDVGPAFGQLLAAIFTSWREKLGTKGFTLVEVGAGEGRLVNDILSSFRRKPESIMIDPGVRRGDDRIRYIAVERSPARREHLKNVEVHPDLNALRGLQGILFANELIDAFPVHRVRVKNGNIEEMYVGAGIEWRRPSTPRLQAYFDRLGITLPEGYETEVNLAMADWLSEASRALQKGLVVLIDYGRPAHEYFAPERDRGTLRCFQGQRVYDPFSSSPAAAGGGSIGPRLGHSGATSLDWTSDVDFTSLALDAQEAGFVPLAFMEMGTFLMSGVKFWAGTRPAPTGLRYLLHPEGLGTAFHVLILGKGIDTANWPFEHNRLARLRC